MAGRDDAAPAEGWRWETDDHRRQGPRPRRVRRMVVSPLDPPFARHSDEVPVVSGPGPVPRNGRRPRGPAAPLVPTARLVPPPPPARPPQVRGLGPPAAAVAANGRGAPHLLPPPGRSAWRATWTTVGAGLGLTLAVGFAWLVLVMLRPVGTPAPPIDELGVAIDQAIADTLLADRVLSVVEWVVSVCTTLVLGGVVFRLLVARRTDLSWSGGGAGAVRALRGAAVVGMLAELASLAPRAVEVSGTGMAAAWDLEALRPVIEARFGDAVLLRIAGLAVLAAFAYRRDRPALEWSGFLAGGTAVLASYALVGHPQATEPAALLIAVQCAHVVVVSTWFGGVTFLAIELHQQRHAGTARASADVVRRFSRVAEIAVALAAASGVALASSQLDSLAALHATGYGRALLVKLAALSVPLAAGAYNRQRLVPAIVRRGEAAAWSRLRRTLALEALFIALGVLLATAAMTSGGL